MATSSITKNFIISGQKQVEMFVDAIESSANNRPVRPPVSARQIKGEAELRKNVFEIFERMSTFSAVIFNAVLGWYLYMGKLLWEGDRL